MTLPTKSETNSIDFWMEIKIILDPKQYHRLRRIALLEGLSSSEFVKQLVQQTLENHDSDKRVGE